MHVHGQFRRRVLLVDGDTAFLQECSNALRKEGYEVLAAEDGFSALHVLRGAQPDLLVVELNLPRMSGFELLSVVRTRFPAISVVAVSGEYTAANVPNEAICDIFLPKSPYTPVELVDRVLTLVEQSPIRASRVKTDSAPVWIPRSRTGWIILTCPECLRSFSTAEPKSSPAVETCVYCGADVRLQMSSVEASPTVAGPPPATDSLIQRSERLRGQSRELISDTERLLKKPRS